MKKINLGSGSDYKEGHTNVDSNRNVKADVYEEMVSWLKKQPDNSIDEIVASNCLEHLIEPEIALREIYRVLKPNGKAIITLPHFNLLDAHRDLTHRFFCTSQTFCEQVQTISYQTNFRVEKILMCCTLWTIVHHLGIRFLELIGYPIYQLTWTLVKE